jgi:hypothetical protein
VNLLTSNQFVSQNSRNIVDFHEEDENDPIFDCLIRNQVSFLFPAQYKEDIERLKQNPL